MASHAAGDSSRDYRSAGMFLSSFLLAVCLRAAGSPVSWQWGQACLRFARQALFVCDRPCTHTDLAKCAVASLVLDWSSEGALALLLAGKSMAGLVLIETTCCLGLFASLRRVWTGWCVCVLCVLKVFGPLTCFTPGAWCSMHPFVDVGTCVLLLVTFRQWWVCVCGLPGATAIELLLCL